MSISGYWTSRSIGLSKQDEEEGEKIKAKSQMDQNSREEMFTDAEFLITRCRNDTAGSRLRNRNGRIEFKSAIIKITGQNFHSRTQYRASPSRQAIAERAMMVRESLVYYAS